MRCLKCGALLPCAQPEPDYRLQQLFSIEEGRSYPTPRENFDTENLAQLRFAIDEYLEGGDILEVKGWIRHIRKGFVEFSTTGVEGLSQAFEVERTFNSQGDFHHDVGYLVRQGILICEEGLNHLEEAAAQEQADALIAAVDEFANGNNYICTALLLIADRKQMLDDAIELNSGDGE